MTTHDHDEKIIKDKKFVCPGCNFESAIPGYCPIDDENYMKKVCECESGMYASECCEPELEAQEREMEKAIEEEFTQEVEKEVQDSIQKELEEVEEETSDEEAEG